MNTFVGITDREWFDLLSSRLQLDESDCRQPPLSRLANPHPPLSSRIKNEKANTPGTEKNNISQNTLAI